MRRWSGIAERSQRLAECFRALVADADFMRMVDDFDGRTSEMFKGESIPTLGSWVRIGIRFTAAMRDGSSLPAIIEVSKKMQGICRRAKKDMKRLGGLYWSKLDAWDAMRGAI